MDMVKKVKALRENIWSAEGFIEYTEDATNTVNRVSQEVRDVERRLLGLDNKLSAVRHLTGALR